MHAGGSRLTDFSHAPMLVGLYCKQGIAGYAAAHLCDMSMALGAKQQPYTIGPKTGPLPADTTCCTVIPGY